MFRAFAAALVFIAVFACDEPRGGRSCRLNSDCEVSEMCFDGRCVVECREDRDCPRSSDVCSDGRCTPMEPVQRLCSSPADCNLSETCRAGVCVEVSIVRAEDSGVSSPLDASSSIDGGGSSTRDGGTPDAEPRPLLPYGAVCLRGSDCMTSLCLGPQGAPSGRCTKACTIDNDCFYPDRCVDVPGAGKLCGPATSGRSTGEACPNGPNECASGLCLGVQSGPICTQQCAPLPICPPGLACAPVADGSGGAVAVCAPGNGRGFGDACTAGSQCASALCLGVGGSAGVCTSMCAQIPCPAGYSCASVDDGAGGMVSICAPMGATGGGFGASCAGASQCASGLCLSDARTGGAFCTERCVVPQDCSAIAGLVCVVLTSGDRVCAPP